MDNATAWDRYAAAGVQSAHPSTDVVHYGPDLPTEGDLRLLGDLRAKRVLELGCGAVPASIAFAKQGATAIAVDVSAQQLLAARRRCDEEGVRVDLRQADMADLAFLRADTVDLVFSADAFGYVEDLGRVLRQVHRVLKVGAPLVFSIPHPARLMIDEAAEEPLLVRRSYFDRSPVLEQRDGIDFVRYRRTLAELYMGLVRASYRVDALVEPEPPAGGRHSAYWHEAFTMVPPALVVRARKEGN